MMIKAPRFPVSHPDYDLECQEALELAMMKVIDDAVQAGWASARVYPAAAEVVANLARAYEQDPDPAGV